MRISYTAGTKGIRQPSEIPRVYQSPQSLSRKGRNLAGTVREEAWIRQLNPRNPLLAYIRLTLVSALLSFFDNCAIGDLSCDKPYFSSVY